MYMDVIKLFAENEKELETLKKSYKNIQSGHRGGIWHRKISNADNEKKEMMHDERNGITKSRQN